jgi:hypothetical protein
LNPNNSSTHYALAVALYRQGNLAEARDEYRFCLQDEPNAEDAADARKAIAEINEALANAALSPTKQSD